MNALLWVDLEGVAGVDHVTNLLEGELGFEHAQDLLAGEISAACEGLARGGAAGVVVADTHRGGPSPTVLRSQLPRGAQLFRATSGYEFAALEQVSAVAMLGMHAGEAGFMPHTLDLSCVWESEGRAVGESDLVLGLAAERGIPALFIAGDDSMDSRGLPFLATKHALSPTQSKSRDVEEVRAELKALAAGKAMKAPGLPGPLVMKFRSRWMAELAERSGAKRLGETRVQLAGATLEARVKHGDALVSLLGPYLNEALRPWALPEDAGALATRPFSRSTPSRQPEAVRALRAFLKRTEANDVWSRAQRALTLHMLEGHAPAFFQAQQLGPVLAQAVERLEVPTFEDSRDERLAMARLDAVYVLRERGRKAPVDEAELQRCIAQVAERNEIYGWLMGELAHQLGLKGRVAMPPRPFRQAHRVADLYWLTHLFLLETRYFQKPLPAQGFESMTEELLLASAFVVAQGELDLAAELAFCIVAAGEQHAPERELILSALADAQEADGTVGQGDPTEIAHATSAALLAFATAT